MLESFSSASEANRGNHQMKTSYIIRTNTPLLAIHFHRCTLAPFISPQGKRTSPFFGSASVDKSLDHCQHPEVYYSTSDPLNLEQKRNPILHYLWKTYKTQSTCINKMLMRRAYQSLADRRQIRRTRFGKRRKESSWASRRLSHRQLSSKPNICTETPTLSPHWLSSTTITRSISKCHET